MMRNLSQNPSYNLRLFDLRLSFVSVKSLFQTALASCVESITAENENGVNSNNVHLKLDHLPSPETTESRIHHFLCSQV